MQINSLRIGNFRNIAEAVIDPHPSLNVFYGDNGAGKTSVLECIYLLARGKSFRTVRAEELIGPQTGAFRIFLELAVRGSAHRIGLERDGRQWKARRDGEDVVLLSELSRDLPVVLMEPNSHQLVAGPPDVRRRFVDWGVFHVEHTYLELWRRYARALKQRNAALRRRECRVLNSLDQVLGDIGECVDQFRSTYCERLAAALPDSLPVANTALDDLEVVYRRGWKEGSLQDALEQARSRDLEQGVTAHGPHRAELEIRRQGEPVRSRLSRGEQKGLAAALLLTQARLLGDAGERPVLLLDDLASEFDRRHLESVLAQARTYAGQLWITGVERLPVQQPHAVFHVEHGAVRKMV